MMSLLRALSVPLLAVALIGSAGCGASDEDPDYKFNAQQMEQAVAGDWQGDITFTGKAAATFQLHLEHVAPSTTPACGSRTLTQVQCIDATTMGLKGTLSTSEGTYDAAQLTGSFLIEGTDMRYGVLYLTLPGSSTLQANYDNGAFKDCQIWTNGQQSATFTMTRK